MSPAVLLSVRCILFFIVYAIMSKINDDDDDDDDDEWRYCVHAVARSHVAM